MRRVALLAAALVGLLSFVSSPSLVQARDEPTTSSEQRLAERFAPIVMLKSQEHPCDSDGEPYAPTSADIVLDNPDVVLRQVGSQNPVLMRAPGAADLFERSEGFFLDFPGGALAPGCIYEQDFDRYSDTTTGHRQPVVYAHVATQDDHPNQLALQYWSFWYYNDWNNKHEGDWEGIQLLFDASSVDEALATEPVSVGYAQHEGGESADWNGSKLHREGDHPIVYPSAGSHASYYGSALYIGRSASEGFGCDATDGPSDRTVPSVVVLPDDVDEPTDPLAWLTFDGRWGERQSGPFNGPTGPRDKPRWDRPIDWHEDLRPNSVVVPTGDSQGDAVVHAFCNTVEWGSTKLVLAKTSPVQVVIAVLILAVIARWLIGRTVWDEVSVDPLIRRRQAGQIIRAAASSYRRRSLTLITFGLVYLPMAIVVGAVTGVLSSLPLVHEVIALGGKASATSLTFALLAGSIANFVSYVAVNAMVSAYYEGRARGADDGAFDAVRRMWSAVPQLLIGFGRAAVIVIALFLSVVGIPWAIRQLVRYQLMPQVVMIEGVDARAGLARSAHLVRGRWWHTALMVALFNLLVSTSGLIVGLLLLLVASGIPLWAFSAMITVVYALIVPLAALAQTLLYGDMVAEESERAGSQVSAGLDREPIPSPR